MNKLLLGRYIPQASILHQLDPRLKLVAGFYLIALIFLCHNVATYALMFLFLVLLIFLSRVKISFFIKGLKSMIWLILLTVGLQLLFSSGTPVLFHFGIINITGLGIKNALFVFLRFVLIISFSTLLTLTTSPLALADATESLLSPLKKFHVPVHEIALMLSIALRFVPTLMDEAQKIMDAQRSRGVDFDSGNLIQKAKAMIPLLIPLFVSCFNRAEELADAMESRGYKGGENRSKFRRLTWQIKDTLGIIVMIILTIVLVIVG